jgi:hypothetical protein
MLSPLRISFGDDAFGLALAPALQKDLPIFGGFSWADVTPRGYLIELTTEAGRRQNGCG